MAALDGAMTETSWKLFYGSYGQGLHGGISLKNSVHGKQPTIDSIVGQRKTYGRVFFELRGEIDTEWVFTDGSYVRAHQRASGAPHGEERAIGKSRGGATTKIHIAADAHGNPIDLLLDHLGVVWNNHQKC